jgi:hypothetical protein
VLERPHQTSDDLQGGMEEWYQMIEALSPDLKSGMNSVDAKLGSTQAVVAVTTNSILMLNNWIGHRHPCVGSKGVYRGVAPASGACGRGSWSQRTGTAATSGSRSSDVAYNHRSFYRGGSANGKLRASWPLSTK